MTQEPPRPISSNLVQASGQVAGDVVAGLKMQPALLGLIVLVAIGVAANYWFINHLVEQGHERTMFLFEHCLGDGAPPKPLQDRIDR